MLVLSRKIGEAIVIEGGVHVRVLAMDKRHVRLGIVAPENVVVDREEVHERRQQFSRRDAASLPARCPS